MDKAKKQSCLNCSPETQKRLSEFSEKSGMRIKFTVDKVINEYLDKMEKEVLSAN